MSSLAKFLLGSFSPYLARRFPTINVLFDTKVYIILLLSFHVLLFGKSSEDEQFQ